MLQNFTLKISNPLVDRHLNGSYLASSYPTGRMPFYLYGSPSEPHIDHALLTSPNIQLSAADVKLDLPGSSSIPLGPSEPPLVLMLDDVREEQMQPFPSKNSVLATLPDFFFQPGKKFEVSIWKDPCPGEPDAENIVGAWQALGRDGGEEGLVARGTMVLGESAFVDAEQLNFDPHKRVDAVGAWAEEFKKIGKELDK
jgi:hypothetical protein